MNGIQVDRDGSALRLHSCPTCGRHAWLADGREVDRAAVLDSLRVRERPAAGRGPARRSRS